jgi:hypothetical protein
MFDDVIVVSRQRVLTGADEVTALEGDLGVAMPPGYAEFVTALGEGTYCDGLQVKLPAAIRRDLPGARERWADYWFWDEAVLTREEATGAVLVADTDTGDEIVVHPRLPGQILVLPRDSDEVVDVGAALDDLLDWYCTSGLVATPVGVRWFMSWAGHTTPQNWQGGDPDRIRAALLALGLHAAYEDDGDGATRFVMPAIGGQALLTRGDWGCTVSLRYDSDLRDRVAPLAHALTEAGADSGAPWGDVG